MFVHRVSAALLPLLALAAALAGCAGAPVEGRAAGGATEAVVRRGALRTRLLLTGELEAAEAAALTVPRTPSWQLQIRWLEQDGAAVKAGQKVVELDNSSFASDLEEKKLKASEAARELERMTAEARTTDAEKEFAVQQKRTELQKAKVAAAVPADLLSQREHQEREVAVRRAEVELAKAETDLAAHRQGSAADLAVRRIELDKSQREIRQAEAAIAALTLRAPRDGLVLIADHPWEGRKLREGDNVWVGFTVATLPDLASMTVRADLSDVDDGRVTPGMEVLCTPDAYPSETFHGRVVDLAAVAQESARRPLLRSFAVRIHLDRLDPRLRPGMSVRVEVLGPEVKDALLAPRAALDLAVSPPRARLADGRTAAVRLGACVADACVVEQGLREGERLRVR